MWLTLELGPNTLVLKSASTAFGAIHNHAAAGPVAYSTTFGAASLRKVDVIHTQGLICVPSSLQPGTTTASGLPTSEGSRNSRVSLSRTASMASAIRGIPAMRVQ